MSVHVGITIHARIFSTARLLELGARQTLGLSLLEASDTVRSPTVDSLFLSVEGFKSFRLSTFAANLDGALLTHVASLS